MPTPPRSSNKTASEAEPHIQPFGRRDPADRLDDHKRSTDCPFRIVFMCFRIAEIDEHSVAHILGDKAGEAGDRIGNAVVISADDLSQILGIVAR